MICEKCHEYIDISTDGNYNVQHTRLFCPDCGAEYYDDFSGGPFILVQEVVEI